MVHLQKELTKTGFSINPLSHIIKKKQGKSDFNTLKYFCILLILDDLKITIEEETYEIKSNSLVFIGPHKMLSFHEYKRKEIFIYSFSSLFYEQYSNNPTCLYSILFFNSRTDIFHIPYVDASKNMIKYYLVERLYNFQNKNEELFISAAYTIIKSLILDASLALNSKINEKTEKSQYTTNILTSFNMKIKMN
ncbi:hypothetical protein JI747_011325 [Chryseobacterium sp. RG1]|uniref:AraC family transcriptional regulator n=1 Tax=Chryseobacterium tagetis TaxID=2801334 RepID=A0ABS8A2V5_9FLAO|nr:hypothetical protein [Chryseobacterium tagetis]MCA6067772.1 hypothetical protein [Chryseobacterium tagetis]